MPGYKAHVAFALFWYVAVLFLLCTFYSISLMLAIELALSMVIGSLFPDIDIKSKGQKYTYTALFISAIPLLVMGYFTVVAVVGWIFCIPMMVRHRGIFHDPLSMSIIIAALFFGWTIYYPAIAKKYSMHVICFVIGMHSHVMLDYGFFVFLKKLSGASKKRMFRYR